MIGVGGLEPDDGSGWAAKVGDTVSGMQPAAPDNLDFVIDTSVPHPARRYDYWLGGKTNYAADRASGDAMEAAFPDLRVAVVENRRFLRQAVSFLAGECGIDQFLDIGTGIPSPGNTHEVVQAINPAARVVYVDNDPVVLAHSRALLPDTPQGRTAFIQADLRDPQAILSHPALTATLDLTRPVGLLLVAVLHFLHDDDRPHAVVRQLVDALPSGSYLALAQGTYDLLPADAADRFRSAALAAPRSVAYWARSVPEIERFFTGLDPVPPGIVTVNRWHADSEHGPRPTDAETSNYGGVARIR